MKSGYKVIILLFSTMFLWACGGGGDIKDDGEKPPVVIPDVVELSVELVDSNDVALSKISREVSGVLKATLKLNDAAFPNKRVTFNLEGQGLLSTESSLTNANGIAMVDITTGDIEGTGRVTASFTKDDSTEITSLSVDFEVAGDLTPPHPIEQYSLNLDIVDGNGQTDFRKIGHEAPGTVVAKLVNNQLPVSNQIINFSIDGQGSINPSVGTALSNNDGNAKVTLLTGTEPGAGTVTASFTLQGRTINQPFNYEVLGDAPGGGIAGNQMTVQLLNSTNNQPVSRISALAPGLVSILLSNQDNEPLAGKVVSFASSLGGFLPNKGTALTDSIGRATILLTAGSVEGAAEVTATYGNAKATIGFVTAGDEIDPIEASPVISFNIYDCSSSTSWNRNLRNFEVCEITDNITNDSPGIIGAKVTRLGSTQTLNQVLVSATTTLGAVSPDSGTAITNSDGKAVFDLYANGQVGAGELTLGVQSESNIKAFEIGRVDISLALNASLVGSLPAGGSTVLDVTITNPDGSLATGQPFNLTFNSECKAAGKALIDSPVVSNAGRAYTTYKSIGCEGDDTVTVSASTGGSAVTAEMVINVDSVNIGSIQYISAQPTLIALKGSGGISGVGARSENSIVNFTLLDQTGEPASNELVCFELSTEVGGLSLAPQPTLEQFNECSNLPSPPTDLNTPNKYAAAYTNNDGEVAVTVSSGNIPTSVKVYAQWQGSNGQGHDTVISNVSDQLRVTTGLTDNRNFSMAASIFNPEAWSVDGETVDITVRASDRFNNIVPNGVSVTFKSEGGDITGDRPNDGGCTIGENGNALGTCSVTWTSAGTRPFDDVNVQCPNGGFTDNSTTPSRQILTPPCTGNLESLYFTGENSVIAEPRPGRATVTAFTIGEENFIDLNSNGLFDLNETFIDQGEAFTDHNEDGKYRGIPFPAGAEREEFFDYNNNNQYDLGDGKYTGLLCSESAAALCSSTGADLSGSQVNVFRNISIIMAGSVPMVRLIDITGDTMNTAGNIDLITNTSETIFVFVSDVNNNTLPYGTTVRAVTANGVIEGITEYEIGSNNANHPLRFQFTVGQESTPNEKTSGLLQIIVKTPRGSPVVSSLTVNDGG